MTPNAEVNIPHNRLRPEERYLRDPVFRSLVDHLERHLDMADYTPSELREAAILAAIRTENRRNGLTRLLSAKV